MSSSAPGDPFVLGVNYWPRQSAMYWWQRFDLDIVRRDFALVSSLGLSVARIFLLWEDFQPAPDAVSERALDHLEQVCDAAAEHQLGLDVTFFTGHMSGPSWVPSWMLLADEPMPRELRQVVSDGTVQRCGYRNPFSDPLVSQASELLVRAVVSRLASHPAIWLWNLGNEPDLFARPEDAAAGRRWAGSLATLIRSLDPSHGVTCGLYSSSLTEDNGLPVHEVFAELDLAAIHGYPMYEAWLDDPLDPDWVPFLCAATRALSGKPTLMEEFGGCTVPPGQPTTTWRWHGYGKQRRKLMASEQDLACYVEAVLPELVEVGATGALLWCFADYVPELYDRPPCDHSHHERHFGLLRPDGSLKPHAEVLRAFAGSKPVIQQLPRRIIEPPATPEQFYAAPAQQAARLFRDFRHNRRRRRTKEHRR